MSKSDSHELLGAYLDDELSDQDRVALEKQLSDSAELRRALEDLKSIRKMIRALPTYELPESFADSILRRAERQMLLGASKAVLIVRSVRWFVWIPVALAATLAGVLLLPPWLNRTELAKVADKTTAEAIAEDRVAVEPVEESRRDQPASAGGSRFRVADDGASESSANEEHRMGIVEDIAREGTAGRRRSGRSRAMVMNDRMEMTDEESADDMAPRDFGIDAPDRLLVEVRWPQGQTPLFSPEILSRQAGDRVPRSAPSPGPALGEIYAVQGSIRDINGLLVNLQDNGALIRNRAMNAELAAAVQKPGLKWQPDVQMQQRGLGPEAQRDNDVPLEGLQVAKVGEFPPTQSRWAMRQEKLKPGKAAQKLELEVLNEALEVQRVSQQDQQFFAANKKESARENVAVDRRLDKVASLKTAEEADAEEEGTGEQLTLYLWIREQDSE